MTSGMPGRLVPLDEEPLHRPDRQRAVDVAAAAGPLARGGADVRAHRRDRVRLARQDVALLEPALGGEVEVAAAVRPDRTGFLALDVALEPGGVDGLDEEFLGLLDGQAGVPFPGDQDSGANGGSAGAPTLRIYHPPPSAVHGAALGACVADRARSNVDGRAGRRRLTAAPPRSYAAASDGASNAKEHEPRDAGSVTASEFSFLALGLVLGVVSGAALVELVRARPPATHEVRLTVTHDAIPRRASTLADDAFVSVGPEPARGGPADRRLVGRPDVGRRRRIVERTFGSPLRGRSGGLARRTIDDAGSFGARRSGSHATQRRRCRAGSMEPALPLTGSPGRDAAARRPRWSASRSRPATIRRLGACSRGDADAAGPTGAGSRR